MQRHESWLALLRTVQFNQVACDQLGEALRERHEAPLPDPEVVDAPLLRQLKPLILFYDKQMRSFPESSVGRGCAMSILVVLFQAAAEPGAKRADVLDAVRGELEAQLADVATADQPLPLC